MDTEIEAVVFDFGGVLTQAPSDHHIETLRTLCGLDRPAFELQYRRQRPDYDRGTIDSRQYWSRIIRSGGASAAPKLLRSLLEADTAGWTRINEPVLSWARQLQKAGVRTGILSNMPRQVLQLIQERFRWLDRFEVRIFSCDLGVVKPESGIYRACLDALGLEGSQILFLDDVGENVNAAKRAGIKAVVFRDLNQALRDIAVQGWLPVSLIAEQEIN